MPNIDIIRFKHFAPRRQDRYPVTENGLLLVEQGSLTITLDSGESDFLTAGEFAFYNSGLLKDAQANPDQQGFSAIALIFSLPLLQLFRSLHSSKLSTTQRYDALFKFNQQDQRLNSVKELLIEEVEHKKNRHAQQYLALALMSMMVERQPELLGVLLRASHLSETEKIIQFIEAHLDEEISLESLAHHMGMSTATLKRRLAAKEMSFSQLLKIKRISHAATQLRTTRKSITTIAFESGFKSAAHFSTAFKSVHKVTPKEFRARVQITTLTQ